jgi:hypothetical protein
MSCPLRNKLQINKFIDSEGIVGSYELGNNTIVRFLVENAGGSNEFVVRMKLKEQIEWVDITTLTGNASYAVQSDTYDLIQIECTNLDGTNVILLASGYLDV